MYLLIIALSSWGGGDSFISNTFKTEQLCKNAQLEFIKKYGDVKIVVDCLYTGGTKK